jgi:hypothetical protein
LSFWDANQSLIVINFAGMKDWWRTSTMKRDGMHLNNTRAWESPLLDLYLEIDREVRK